MSETIDWNAFLFAHGLNWVRGSERDKLEDALNDLRATALKERDEESRGGVCERLLRPRLPTHTER